MTFNWEKSNCNIIYCCGNWVYLSCIILSVQFTDPQNKKITKLHEDFIGRNTVEFHFDGLRSNEHLPQHVKKAIHEAPYINWRMSKWTISFLSPLKYLLTFFLFTPFKPGMNADKGSNCIGWYVLEFDQQILVSWPKL